jgi:hypothetical protein
VIEYPQVSKQVPQRDTRGLATHNWVWFSQERAAEARGGEMEYDGRVAGIGVSAGKESDMGRRGQIGDRRWWETGSLDVVQLVVRANGYLLGLSRRNALSANLIRNDPPPPM